VSYEVLARKWRPQTFADLVGQEHVATTLANSIALGRIAHAFLFTGVRGVGKTTSARILAKALNCEQGPTATPCLRCPPCVDIAAGRDMDVIEMDAASNRGINDVKQLQETVAYRPARDRFKVYIVDEVHMLTSEAWNAFLKTLEEPPPHVEFIFATTEVHKVPATILSRVQRYDFKLISASAVAARVRHVLSAEGIQADDGAVALVAREAAGSMRDAMSLLDQVIAWAGPGTPVTLEGATQVLGVAARSVLHRLAAALVRGEAGGAIEIVGELAETGFDIQKVGRDFLDHLRDLVVAKVAPEGRGLSDVPEQERVDLVSLAAETSVEDLTRLHLGLSRTFDEIMKGASPRASLEMALVRLARRPPLVPIDELLRRLGELERRLEGAGGGGSAAPVREPTRGAPGHGPAPRGSAREASPSASLAADGGRPAAEPPGPPLEAAPPAPAPRAVAPAPAWSPPPVARAQLSPPPTDGPGVHVPELAEDDPMLAAFRDVVAEVHAHLPGIASVLEHAALVEASPRRLVVGFEPGSFLASQLGEARALAVVRDAARARLGPDVEVAIVAVPRDALGGTLARRASEVLRGKIAEAEKVVREHPIVAAAVEILGAELREVHLAPELASAASWERRGERG
jgi:DNA polymerase-3 subunit gamma/tau